jgi:Protein of unknown function (DUF2862)
MVHQYRRIAMEIGQKVRLRRLKHRVSADIINRLGQTGTVRDFKIVDGKEIASVVQFDDQFATWFFEDELEVVK